MYHIWVMSGKLEMLFTASMEDVAGPIAETISAGKNEKARQRRAISLILLSKLGCGDRI
jgi:hypothetical protein